MRDSDLLEILRTDTDPVRIARAGAQLAARSLATAYADGVASSKELTALSRALQEVRAQEAAMTDLQRERGELVSRDDLRELAGELAGLLLRALESHEHALADKVGEWLASPDVALMGPPSRRREVLAWCRRQGRELRARVAEDLQGGAA